MSESIERRIIHRRIAKLEEEVRVEHRYIDSLYEKYGFEVDRVLIQDCVETIHQRYDELLILKGIIMDADDEAGLADRS